MHGLVLPVPVSGHPALELCNTRAGWGALSPKEYLHDYQHLATLAADQALVSTRVRKKCLDLAARDPSAARSTLRRALRVRSDLYRVLIGDHDAAVLNRFNADLLRARRHLQFRGIGSGAAASWVDDPVRMATPLDAFARAAEGLLSGAPVCVAACPGHGCGWLFTDPAGRRTWCSMRWCGNRAKVARHAARRSGGS